MWLSADSISQGDNSNVGNWQDLSGNGNNAAGVSNPRFRTPGIGSKPAIEFNGTNEYYNLGDLSGFTLI